MYIEIRKMRDCLQLVAVFKVTLLHYDGDKVAR